MKKECPHCGDKFSPQGLPRHKSACGGFEFELRIAGEVLQSHEVSTIEEGIEKLPDRVKSAVQIIARKDGKEARRRYSPLQYTMLKAKELNQQVLAKNLKMLLDV